MIILIRGTKDSQSENYADRIIAALSLTSMLKFNRKTLVLQVAQNLPVENVLKGRDLKANKIGGSYSFNDTGIDAMLRQSRAGKLSPVEFSDFSINLSKDNGLDIAEVSTADNFKNLIRMQPELFYQLLRNADEVYDVVFLFVNGSDEDLVDMIRKAPLTDATDNTRLLIQKEVVCVPQGNKKEFEKDENAIYVVKNYDSDSVFTIRSMQRMYGKNVFAFPYNVGYKDACIQNNALYFLARNQTPMEDDVNYEFVNALEYLTGGLLGEEYTEAEERRFVFRR